MTTKDKPPREAEVQTAGCKCDYCGASLDKKTKVWFWNEHFGCSRDCVIRAQGETNKAYRGIEEGKDVDLL